MGAYWKQLLEPDDFRRERQIAATGLFPVPAFWSSAEVQGTALSGEGFATYRLRVLLPDSLPLMAMRVPDAFTAYLLWVDGVPVASNGTVGTQRASTIPERVPRIVTFAPHGQAVELVMQVANFDHVRGGTAQAPLLGIEPQIRDLRERALVMEVLILGMYLMTSLYHFLLYWFRRRDSATLYFGIICALGVMYILVGGERLLVQYFDPPFEWVLKCTFLSFILLTPVGVLYLDALFPAESSRRIVGLCKGFSVAVIAFILVSSVRVYSRGLIPFQLLVPSFLPYAIFTLARAVKHRREGSILALVGMVAATIGGVCAIAVSNQMSSSQVDNFTYFTVPVTLVLQTYFMSRRSARVTSMAEDLSANLEQKVVQRTHELHFKNE